MSVGLAGLLGFLIVFVPSMFFLARWWNELGLKDLEPPREIEKKEIVLKIERDSKFLCAYLKNKKIPTTNCIGFYKLWFRRISVKDGVWEYFDENGKCQTRVNFKNGKRVK